MRYAASAQLDDLSGLRARPYVELLFTVECRHLDDGAESSGCHRQRHCAVQVVAVTLQHRMRQLVDLDVQVARRTAARSDLPFSGEPDAHAVLDSGRDLDRERAPRADPSVTAALRARMRDDGAGPLALRARARGHHLTEERPADLAHLTAPMAGAAGRRMRAGCGARAAAGVADQCGVDGDVARRPEGRLNHFEVHLDERVGTGTRARP